MAISKPLGRIVVILLCIPEAGIPAYNWWNEALHGVGRNGKATAFPQPIGMAASFDEALLYEAFTAVSGQPAGKEHQHLTQMVYFSEDEIFHLNGSRSDRNVLSTALRSDISAGLSEELQV